MAGTHQRGNSETAMEDFHRRLAASGEDGGGFGGGLKISIPKGREHGDVLPIPLDSTPASPSGRVTRSASRASARPPPPAAGGLASPLPPSAGGLFPQSGFTILRSPRDLFGFNSPLCANSPRGPNPFSLQTPGSRGFSPRTVELYMRQFADSGVLSPRSAFSAPNSDAGGADTSAPGAAAPANEKGAARGKSPRAGSKRKR